MSEIERYYNGCPGYEWERLKKHRTEFAVTMRALGDYLPKPPARILDVGGGVGRYAIALTERGYDVSLVDISKESMEFAREKAKGAGVEISKYVTANATDLSRFQSEVYDAVLLLGPLYHLLRTEDRQKAVDEAKRVLRPSGLIFTVFIPRYAAIRDRGKHSPEWLNRRRDRIEELLATGILRDSPEEDGFTDAYLVHPPEIRPFMERNGFETLNLIACEGVVSLIEEKINELTGDLWESWVELNYRLGRDPSIHGAAEHLLYVGTRK